MDYRKLQGTDLSVSTLCFGTMRAATPSNGSLTPADARSKTGQAALHAALDAGINFIHSSYEYGVRWMLHEALKSHPKRHDLHHVIKVPVPDWEDGGVFDAVKFRSRIETALHDLATDKIALLQWMWRTQPNIEIKRLEALKNIVNDVTETFEKLREEGKVQYMASFPYTLDSATAAINTQAFSGLIAYYNPLEMEMASLFAQLDANNMNFLAIRPLFEGVLTDQRKNWQDLAIDDRLKSDKYQAAFDKRHAIATEFADEIAQEGGSMTRFALRFPLYSKATASVVVGLNSPEQVTQVVNQMDAVKLRPDVVQRALKLWQHDFKMID